MRIGRSKRLWPTIDSFFSAISENIRCILIDRARRKNAQKRRGERNVVSIVNHDPPATDRSHSEIEIVELIERLSANIDPVKGKLLQMRMHGYGRREIMAELDLSSSTYDCRLLEARKILWKWTLGESLVSVRRWSKPITGGRSA